MVSFKDQATAYTYEVGSAPDATFETAENNDADLGDFLERPQRIANYQWSTSVDNFYQSFNPWSLFFENPRVINRITNFNNLRCKLHLRVLINGNGFHFGRLLMNYKPKPGGDLFTRDRALTSIRKFDNIAASQRPHIYLDPTFSQGGDMILPFFHEDNYLSIPAQEWREMGEISIRTLQNLRHANGADDIVRISIFAWAEDVILTVPTSAEPGALLPQSGEDEYGKGPISRPASIVARAAGKLANVPYIGAYARATEIAANTTSSVATVFGYSRPNNLDDIKPYKPTVVGNLANTNVPDSAAKLSLDCKQELTVDPCTVGLTAVDEMTITSIACRESYLTSFEWSPNPGVHTVDSGLFQIDVTPFVPAKLTVGAVSEYHLPACAFIAQPFEQWRGSMRYRFQVVCSNYHKGRLKIVYDPYAFESNEFNTNYTHIIDIAEEKDFTIDIGWGTTLPYCDVGNLNDPIKFAFNTDPASPSDKINGVLNVYVVNDLTLPSAAAADQSIEVNVFVSAGEDIAFRNPTDSLNNVQYFPNNQSGEEYYPQSGEEKTGDVEDTEEPSKPMQEETEASMLAHLSTTDAFDHVFYGESIESTRSLLKRYSRHSTFVDTGDDGVRLVTNSFSSFPFFRGFAPGAITPVDVGDNNFNFAHNTLINYLSPAYMAWRGGLRWKFNPMLSRSTRVATSYLSVHREPNFAGYREASVDLTGSAANIVSTLNVRQSEGMAGITATNDIVNPALEVEIPYQLRRRFSPARDPNHTTPINGGNVPDNLTLQYITSTNASDINLIDKFVSVGEDFSLFFFVGCPVQFYIPANPSL